MNYKKPIVNIVMLYLMIMCFGLSLGYKNAAKPEKEVANIYLENSNLTATDINNMHMAEANEKVKLSFTGWKQIDDETISYPYFQRSTKADIIKVCGNSSLIIEGSMLFLEDIEGCIIDEDTAYDLFGSLEVFGNIIEYNNRKLTVVGVQNKLKNTVIMQAENNSEEKMDAIALELNGKGSRTIKDFNNRYGISEDATAGVYTEVVEGNIYSNIANIFTLILPLIIITIVLFNFIKKINKVKRKPVLFLIYIIICCVFVGLFIKLMEFKISIPYDLIPNKWSDFDYWGRVLSQYKDKYETILYMKKYNIDIILIKSMFKSIFFSILAIGIFFNIRKKIKASNSEELFMLLTLIIIFTFTVVLICRLKFGLEIQGLKIWLLIPYYYLGNYIKDKEIL